MCLRYIRFDLQNKKPSDMNESFLKIKSSIEHLALYSPEFSNWYFTRRPPKGKKYEEAFPDIDLLEKTFIKEWRKSLIESDGKSSLGIVLSIKHKINYQEAFVLNFSIGNYGSKYVGNSVSLSLPNTGYSFQTKKEESIFFNDIEQIMTKIWNPINIEKG